MFYDRFRQLSQKKGISVHRATQDIGLSKSTATKWKKTGAIPSGETLSRIAAYFDVSVDSLLGTGTAGRGDISFDSFTYAMAGESAELTEEEKEQLLNMAKFFNRQRKKETD